MPLIAEDGTGIAGANAYLDAVSADAYFSAHLVATWLTLGTTTAAREAALIRGCAYLEAAYRSRWIGYRTHDTQGLAWPRCNTKPVLYDIRLVQRMATAGRSYLKDLDGFPISTNQVPQRVKDANCEAALLSLQGFDFTKVNNAAVSSESKTVDRVSYSRGYATPLQLRDQKLVAIDNLLKGLILSAPGATFGMTRVMRG